MCQIDTIIMTRIALLSIRQHWLAMASILYPNHPLWSSLLHTNELLASSSWPLFYIHFPSQQPCVPLLQLSQQRLCQQSSPQNSSSALRQRDCLSRVRRASTSAADNTPWILLSLVRTLTPLVIFSFSPTTAKEHTTAWHGGRYPHTLHVVWCWIYA